MEHLNELPKHIDTFIELYSIMWKNLEDKPDAKHMLIISPYADEEWYFTTEVVKAKCFEEIKSFKTLSTKGLISKQAYEQKQFMNRYKKEMLESFINELVNEHVKINEEESDNGFITFRLKGFVLTVAEEKLE